MPKPLRVRSREIAGVVEVQAPRTKSRRRFSAAEKRRIVELADGCAHGQLGGLLRTEGIYHSQLAAWRLQALRSGTEGLAPKRPGPTPKRDAKDRQIDAMSGKIKRLEKELGIVNGLVELQKKAQALIAAMREEDGECTR